MTEIQFFRRALWVPIMVPAVAGLLTLRYLNSSNDSPLARSVVEPVSYIALAGLVAFLPYALVAIALDRHLARAHRFDRRLLLIVPPAVASLATLLVAVAAPAFAPAVFFIGCFFGYGYVALIVIVEQILAMRGKIVRTPDSTTGPE